MEVRTLRQKFTDFFVAKGYQTRPAASLLPENDPSVLFTTAGMQQFKQFYTEPDLAPKPRVTTTQPVIRTSDIAEVGDDTHLTMFEMLGNFVFGQKSSMKLKEQAIKEAWQFIHQELGVSKDRVYVTVFAGDKHTPADTESEGIWQSLGLEVRPAGREDNFWGPTGDEGPCGPTTEIYIDGIEVWNLVFNQYYQTAQKKFTPLEYQGLDTGSGLERLAATLQQQSSVWQIEPFVSWARELSFLSEKNARVVIDHLKAIVFLVSAGVTPANKGREYIVRRLIREVVFLISEHQADFDYLAAINQIRLFYHRQYDLLATKEIFDVITKEKEQFEKNLTKAQNYLSKWLNAHNSKDEKAITELAFYMYESFGFPKELVLEHLTGLGWPVNLSHFEKLFATHQDISRSGLAGQFKGGLADQQPQTIKHHTAHHLLLAALRQVLGDSVVQKGSNVTSERLRIDFNFERKLTDDELKKVEAIVNEKIKEDLPVVRVEMSRAEALKSGALAEFGQKYGETVTVYSIGDFSRELCGGPHVEKTGQLGRLEILKEEASSQGVRRIKARLV